MIKNLELNKCKNVKTFMRAVGNDEIVYLNETNPENSGAAHIANVGSKVLSCPITYNDIKNFISHKNIYIKIDTEGYELTVLKNIVELFERHLVRKVVIEIDYRHLNRYYSQVSDIYDFFNKFNFSPTYGINHKLHYDEVFCIK